MDKHEWPHPPVVALVPRFHPQEVQQDGQVLTVIRLGRRRIVVAVFFVVLDDGLEDRLQDSDCMGAGQLFVQLREKLLGRLVLAGQVVQPRADAAVQDRPQAGQV
jgi:hypothetical protein